MTLLARQMPAVPAVSQSMAAFSPLYLQIKTLLLQRLQLGEWKPGEAIPSEIELASRFGVSQGTMRKAIDALAADHLLLRQQGKGTFVATHTERRVRYRFLKLVPDHGDLETQGPAERRIVNCRRLRAGAEVASLLRLRSGDPVLRVRRVLSYGGAPVILEDLWLPGAAFKGLTAARLGDWTGPMYALFEASFGVRMVRADEQIRAVLANAADAALLAATPATPLLSVERLAFTYNDAPMELRRGLYRTEHHHYRNTLG